MKSVLVVVVHMLVPSCVGTGEPDTPTSGISKRLASNMELVQAGQEEEEGADRVEEGDGGVEQVACEHGGQGHAEERGGEHHVERGLDEEAGEAGEEAEEGDDAEEGDGGPGGDRGEVEQAVGDRLEELGDVGSTAGVAAGVTARLLGCSWRCLVLRLTPSSRVCSGIGVTLLSLRLRCWWSRGLFLLRSCLLLLLRSLASWDGLQAKGSQEVNPWGGLSCVRCSGLLSGKELIEST